MIRHFSPAFLVLVLLLAFITPGQAQSSPEPLLDWIPADFGGVIRVQADDPGEALQGIGLLTFVATYLQPSRVSAPPAVTYENYLTALDLGETPFDQAVLSWLQGDIVIAYRSFTPSMNAEPDETLFILPSADPFAPVAALRGLVAGIEGRRVRDVMLYERDARAVAFLPDGVLIGGVELVESALLARAGENRLVDTPAYQAVRAALPDQPIFAYLNGDAARAALPLVISREVPAAQPILSVFADAMTAVRPDAAFDAAVFGGAFDGAGVVLDYQFVGTFLNRATATAALHLSRPVEPPQGVFNPALLEWIPESTMLLWTGADARGAAHNLLIGLPLYNFAGPVFNGFPVPVSPGVADGTIALPTNPEVQQALADFVAALRESSGIDLRADVIDGLTGSYAVALLPRPNNPTPELNTPYDLLIVAEAERAGEVVSNAAAAIRAFLGDDALVEENVGEVSFLTLLASNGDPILRLGALDDAVILATGTGAEAALAAHEDNAFRLTGRADWSEAVGEGDIPTLYADVNALYSSFIPQALGGRAGGIPTRTVTATSRYQDGLLHIGVLVTISAN